MAKINVIFDNANYNVDEQSISSAAQALKTHLSSVMNGSGAVINLDGVSYSIDSAKLTNETNDFISHLRTISGNGKKVVVNGVEFSVDSTKVANAVSDLHTVLGGLNSGDSSDDSDEVIILDEATLEDFVLD